MYVCMNVCINEILNVSMNVCLKESICVCVYLKEEVQSGGVFTRPHHAAIECFPHQWSSHGSPRGGWKGGHGEEGKEVAEVGTRLLAAEGVVGKESSDAGLHLLNLREGDR